MSVASKGTVAWSTARWGRARRILFWLLETHSAAFIFGLGGQREEWASEGGNKGADTQGHIDVGKSVGAKPKAIAYHTRQLETSTSTFFQHNTFPSSITTTRFRWVKGNSFLRVPNGLLSVLLQRCPLKIQRCILISHLAPSEGSWPTSRKLETLSSPSVPKRR